MLYPISAFHSGGASFTKLSLINQVLGQGQGYQLNRTPPAYHRMNTSMHVNKGMYSIYGVALPISYHIYIYIYTRGCVCVCFKINSKFGFRLFTYFASTLVSHVESRLLIPYMIEGFYC